MKDYPFIKFALLFICGIVLDRFVHISIEIFFCGLLLLIILFFLYKKFNRPVYSLGFIFLSYLLILSAGLIIAGISRGNVFYLTENIFKQKNFTAWGVIKEIALPGADNYTFLLSADSLLIEGKSFNWQPDLLIKVKDESKKQLIKQYNLLSNGNRVEVNGTYFKGREERNPGEFDYNKYLRQSGVSGIVSLYDSDSIKILDSNRFVFSSTFHTIRKSIDKQLHEHYSEQAYGLLKGLLLADRSSIDYETKNLFVNSGVVHVLAVSGLHVGFIGIIFYFLFGRLNVYLRIYSTIAGLLFFMFLTGVPPSVFRATVMAVIILLAQLTERTSNIYNSLALAAVILLIIEPTEIFNPGFQLSFSAVLSIAYFYPLFNSYINKIEINKYLRAVLLFAAVSFSAQIGTLPFTLMYFGKLSITSLFANLVVIPLIGVIVGIGITSILFAVISSSIAAIYAAANDAAAWLLFTIVEFAGNGDYSFIRIPDFSLYDAIIYYLLLTTSLFLMRFTQKFLFKVVILFSSAFLFFIAASYDDKALLTPGNFNVVMIDVGQGDSFLLSFPNGKAALIDAGEATNDFCNGERVIIPLLDKLGIEKINYAFISHFDNDHYGGMVSLIYRNKIGKVFLPAHDTSSKAIRFINYLIKNKIPYEYCIRQKVSEGGVSIYAVSRGDDSDEQYSSNDNSVIIKAVYGKNSFLFTGDLERKGEKYFLKNAKKFLDVDVLKVSHHGSKTGSSLDFLEAVTPRISLISAGVKNKFNHPSKEVLARLAKHKSSIYRTDKSGAVILKSDGKNISEISWR